MRISPNSVNKARLAGGRAFIQEEWMFWAERWTVRIQNSLTVFYCFLVMEGGKSKASLPLDSPEDWRNDQSPIDFRYYNVRWWLYWKGISDLSSCLGVISTKLLSLITSNTYYQCQGIFLCVCQFQFRLWGTYCAYVWLTMRLGKKFPWLTVDNSQWIKRTQGT